MNLNKYSKEAVTIGFYIIYLLFAGVCYELFPGNKTTPNFGVLLLFLFIPISFGYAIVHLFKHFNSNTSYLKCLLIHAVAWFCVVTFLTNYAK